MTQDKQRVGKMARNGVLICVGLILLQDFLYGLGTPLAKIMYATVPLYTVLSIRYAIALVPLLVFCGPRIFKSLKSVRIRTWFVPSALIAISYIINNIAIDISSATAAVFLGGLSVIMAPILSFFILRTRYPKRNLPILACLVVGLYLLCALGGITTFGIGEILALLSSLLLAASLVYSGESMAVLDPFALAFTQTALSLVGALICGFALEGGIHPEFMIPKFWVIILYMALACTLTGFILQNIALKHGSAALVAVVQTLAPVVTAVLSVFMINEILSPAGVVGAIIIVACVIATVIFDERDKRKSLKE